MAKKNSLRKNERIIGQAQTRSVSYLFVPLYVHILYSYWLNNLSLYIVASRKVFKEESRPFATTRRVSSITNIVE